MQSTNIWTVILSLSDVSVDISPVCILSTLLICFYFVLRNFKNNLKLTWSILVSQHFLHRTLSWPLSWVNKFLLNFQIINEHTIIINAISRQKSFFVRCFYYFGWMIPKMKSWLFCMIRRALVTKDDHLSIRKCPNFIKISNVQ